MNRDAEDLLSFSAHGDEAAFRRIVERHAPMIHGVAWRRMRDRALAEDVTQSVFMILARKSRSVPPEGLAPWLYRTAFMETLNASRKEAKRQQIITQYTAMTPDHGSEWAEISPHLDEVICQLSAAERKLVLMRYFEQLDYSEIHRRTGSSEPAIRKQMQRALDRLGALLRRKGVTASSGAAVGAVLAAQTLCTPPASAAVIAGLALQSIPAAAGSLSLFSTLSVMTTQTALKTTAAALILAAIPTAILLSRRDNPATASHKIIASGDGGTASESAFPKGLPDVSGNEGARRIQARPERSSVAKTDGHNLGSGILRMADIDWSVATRKQSERFAGRLTARLNLNPEQQSKLNAYLAEKGRKQTEMLTNMTAATFSVAGASASVDLALSSAPPVQIAGNESDHDLNEFLNSILTPEQQDINETFREQEHQESVRRDAQSAIDGLSEYVDLSPEQKQQIFEQSEHRSQSQDSTAPGETPLSAEEEARQVLTPAQLAVYDQGKAEDSQGPTGKYDTLTIMPSIKVTEPDK